MSSVVDPAVAAPVTPAAVPAAPAPTAPAIVVNGKIRLPAGLVDLEAFRAWARENRPEGARVSWLAGEIWIEVGMEQAFSHNDVKSEINGVLRVLVKTSRQGRYFSDGMLLGNPDVGLSTIPDGLYVSVAAVESGRVRLLPGRSGGCVEVQGSPDMVLETVSDSSAREDTQEMPELYRRAGITEFWRVDARGELRFEILRLTAEGYAPTQEPDGWWHSPVFGRRFRLVRQPGALGEPECTLEVRE